MQGLVHGRRSVRDHPKFSTLLDPEGCSGDCIGEGSQSSRRAVDSRGECHGTVEAGLPCVCIEMRALVVSIWGLCMIGAAGELDCFSAHIRLRELGKSEDKAECKSTDSRAMGLAAPWYRRGGTFVESSIPCSHGGRALVVKGAEEPSNLAFSTTKRMGEVKYPSSLTYSAEELCISSLDKSEDKTECFHRVINPLLSWRESVGHKRGRRGGECKGKL
ncbi:hypothetical protein BHM03_00057947 [Ensete ventricosum]|nr:hypothetical protein BHM03_00057947 [Ensete ventricosum]